MRKITLLLCAILMATIVSAQIQRRWQGGQENRVWDYATPNWLNPASPLPFPTTFSEGAHAIFDDSIIRGGDTLRISGSIVAGSVTVNASKPYAIRRVADTDVLTGAGTLIKDGSGVLALDFRNQLAGGTILRNGTLIQERQSLHDVFGSRLVIEGGRVFIGPGGNGSSAYTISTIPIEIPAGRTARVELPRYSNFVSPVTGAGELELLSHGERVHIGYQTVPAGVTAAMPDMRQFTGNIRITRQTSAVTPGFWGIVLSTNRSYNAETNEGIDSTFHRNRITIGAGATLASHSGSRAYLIGELQADDETSILAGFRSSSTTPRVFFLVGSLNTDVVFPGRIAQAPGITTRYNHICFIKVGTGTYTLTNPNNDIIGGMIVREGRVLVNDPALPGNVSGGIGNWVQVERAGTLGGIGRIQGNVDVWGRLTPGSNGIGTLWIRDTFSEVPGGTGGTRAFNLNLHPGSVAEFEIRSAASFDRVVSSGALRFLNDTVNVVANPVIRIVLADGHDIKDGDTFEIIQSRNLHVSSLSYNMEFPTVDGITWAVETVETLDEPASFRLIVKANVAASVSSVIERNVSIFPNPVVGGIANFRSPDTMISAVEIINMQGQVLRHQVLNSNEVNVNLQGLKAGVYYARILTAAGTEVHKVILK